MKYNVPKAAKQKPKNEKCTGKFRHCDPDAPLEEIEIANTVYTYCRPCLSELNFGAGKAGNTFGLKQYSTTHGEPVKAYKKQKLGRKGL